MRLHSRFRLILTAALSFPLLVQAQVTHGQKPQLPPPFATPTVGNSPDGDKPPAGFLPKAPSGFQVNVYASGFRRPRLLTVAPNGDIFLAETGAGRVLVLRDTKNPGTADQPEVFADGLKQPFGIVFHNDYVYIGNTNGVVRFHYDPKTSKRTGEAEPIMPLPTGGHFTRALAFSPDGRQLFISVGSSSNIDIEKDQRRAAISISDPDGKNARIYASGLRNPVGIAIEPVTGQLWTTVNERDELGDDLPPDYLTSVKDGGFYGWPFSYIGDNVDTRVKPQRPDLVAKAIIPDVLLGPHVAPLQFTFYNGKSFPESYRGGAFVAEHGSWNRSTRNGYQIAFVGFKDGKAAVDPVPFLTGFVSDPKGKTVNGRPVGVTTAADGSLLVSDDGAGVIYRISVAK